MRSVLIYEEGNSSENDILSWKTVREKGGGGERVLAKKG